MTNVNLNNLTTTKTEGRKFTVTPMSFRADLGMKLMHGDKLTQTEARYLNHAVANHPGRSISRNGV